MPDIKIGDVVIHDEPGGPTYSGRMLFYVDSLSFGESDVVSLIRVTSDLRKSWRFGAPMNQLVIVGHIDTSIELDHNMYFKRKDIPKFESSYRAALRRGVSFFDKWPL